MYIRVLPRLQRLFSDKSCPALSYLPAWVMDFDRWYTVGTPKYFPGEVLTMNTHKDRTIRAGWRGLMVVLVVVLASVSASAYTIVMRDGRRLSIPNNFVVTNLTLTYSLGEQFQKTVLLVAIDIPATERANNEPAGSFLMRAQQVAQSQPAQVRSRRATQTVTNDQLQRFKTRRLAAEASYERRRKELGLPSKEELRQRAEEQVDRTAEAARDIREREQENERYWRERSSGLRADLAAANAQIDFVRARLNELPASPTVGFVPTYPFDAQVSPFITFSQTAFTTGFRSGVQRPNVFRSPDRMMQNRPNMGRPGHVSFGGARFGARFGGPARARVGVNTGFVGQPIFPFNSVIGGFPYQDFSYERQELMLQLNDLLSQRAALHARWRDLEEEARRAGAYPGWLRP